MASYRQHGWRHDPTKGTDPIPNLPSGGGAPSVATFWLDTDSGDTALTVAATTGANIPWAHADLPSDGLITGPFTSNWFVQFTAPCMTIEFLYTVWDDANYLKAGILGTNDRLGNNDVFALAAAGTGTSDGTGVRYGDATFYQRLNAHITDDQIHGYARNGDSSSHDVLFARLSIFAWAASGYTGAKAAYPE